MWNFVYIYFHYGHFQTENIWIFMQKIMLLKMFNFWRQNSNIIKEKIRKKSGNFCVTKYFILTTILRIWKSTLKWLKLNIIKNRWFLARKFKYFQFWIDNLYWFFRKKKSSKIKVNKFSRFFPCFWIFAQKLWYYIWLEKYLLFSMDDGHIHNPVRNVVCVISTLEQTWYKIQICILESYEKLEHFGFPWQALRHNWCEKYVRCNKMSPWHFPIRWQSAPMTMLELILSFNTCRSVCGPFLVFSNRFNFPSKLSNFCSKSEIISEAPNSFCT